MKWRGHTDTVEATGPEFTIADLRGRLLLALKEIKKTKNFSKKEEKVRKIYRERYIDLDKYMYMYMDIIIYDVMYFYLGI